MTTTTDATQPIWQQPSWSGSDTGQGRERTWEGYEEWEQRARARRDALAAVGIKHCGMTSEIDSMPQDSEQPLDLNSLLEMVQAMEPSQDRPMNVYRLLAECIDTAERPEFVIDDREQERIRRLVEGGFRSDIIEQRIANLKRRQNVFDLDTRHQEAIETYDATIADAERTIARARKKWLSMSGTKAAEGLRGTTSKLDSELSRYKDLVHTALQENFGLTKTGQVVDLVAVVVGMRTEQSVLDCRVSNISLRKEGQFIGGRVAALNDEMDTWEKIIEDELRQLVRDGKIMQEQP